jgi:peptide/nickel transport system substrate-binding protein
MRAVRSIPWMFVGLCAIVALSLTATTLAQPLKNPDALVIVRISSPDSLDPAWANDIYSREPVAYMVYEPLIFFDGGSTSRYIPMLATTVPSVQDGTISKDLQTYTFHIRKGVKFHDGSVMTPDDVKYSIMRFALVDRDSGGSWIVLTPLIGRDSTRDASGKFIPAVFDELDRAIQIKGNDVVFTLKTPYSGFLSIMASFSLVHSKAAVVRAGGWDGSKAAVAKYNNPASPDKMELFEKDAGTGPFRLAGWNRSINQIVLERWDGYWRPPAKLKQLVFKVVADFPARRLMLTTGDADVIEAGYADLASIRGAAGVRVVENVPQLFTQSFFMNMKINPEGNPDIGSGKLDGNGIPPEFFSDIHVRRAVAYAFDYATYWQTAWNGKMIAGNGPVPAGMLGYDVRNKWYQTDREKAVAEFKQAWSGQVWDKGFKFTETFNAGNPHRIIGTRILKENLESLNPKFKVDIRSLPGPSYFPNISAHKGTLYWLGFGVDFADPDDFVAAYMHTGTNYAPQYGYSNPALDKLIEQARTETIEAKRADLYRQIQKIAYDDVPVVYLGYGTVPVVYRAWVHGWYTNAMFSLAWYYYPITKQ